jgi:hypothetical protein
VGIKHGVLVFGLRKNYIPFLKSFLAWIPFFLFVSIYFESSSEFPVRDIVLVDLNGITFQNRKGKQLTNQRPVLLVYEFAKHFLGLHAAMFSTYKYLPDPSRACQQGFSTRCDVQSKSPVQNLVHVLVVRAFSDIRSERYRFAMT